MLLHSIMLAVRQKKILKGLSSEICLAVVSIDRSLFKEEAPRIPADFVHSLSSEMPFKF
jgi:hypothetical protein